ncbi:MAG: aspartate-semialdehyde dehydrogenase [Tenericutes bacterium]|nr:aspartate-semialdehyde dehydrogenase [Mycoplasmatota bacterium]
MKKYNIAILGATGLVGQTFLKVLAEYNIPINELRLFASPRSLGKKILFKDKEYLVDVVKEGSFRGIDYALFSAGASVSKIVALQATKEGAIVIDNSSAFRQDVTIPLVVPEVNLADALNVSLIANPNCSTIQSVLPLSALDKAYGVLEVRYNTYQAVSGSGYKGIEALEKSTDFYPYDIKETCIPQIDDFLEDGFTKEEHKMVNETRRILHKEDLKVSATCIRVPVKYSHGVSISAKLNKEFDLTDLRKVLANFEGIVVLDEPTKQIYPTSIASTGNDMVYVGRIRRDLIDKFTVLLYCVADNVRKGAASNAVQILKGLIDHAKSC